MKKTTVWTQERIDKLLALRESGLTASQIAKNLDTTRNAVLGRVNRLGLSMASDRPRKPSATPKHRAKKPLQINSHKHLETRPTVSVRECKPLMDLKPRECRYPHGDPNDADFSFCGEPSLKHMPYCEEHYNLCYQKRTKPTEN